DPPRRLVETMRALWSEDVKREGTSRVTWEIEPVGDSSRLTVTHDRLRDGANDQLFGGWPMILSGLKTYLETGELLTTPGSLMYATPPASGKRCDLRVRGGASVDSGPIDTTVTIWCDRRGVERAGKGMGQGSLGRQRPAGRECGRRPSRAAVRTPDPGKRVQVVQRQLNDYSALLVRCDG